MDRLLHRGKFAVEEEVAAAPPERKRGWAIFGMGEDACDSSCAFTALQLYDLAQVRFA